MMYNSGDKLKIPCYINPVSDACKDFLQKILESDLRKRMSWETFFTHPIFKIDKSIYTSGNYAPLGSTINGAMQINDRFETYKCAGAPKDEILDYDITRPHATTIENVEE